jgi:membrane-associated phospholipid phosphatase
VLGWHYSIDGFAGAALALGFWWVAGKLTRHWAEFCNRQGAALPVAGGGEAVA